jgi:hypothetical protein
MWETDPCDLTADAGAEDRFSVVVVWLRSGWPRRCLTGQDRSVPPEPTLTDAETADPDPRQSQVMSGLVLNFRLSHGQQVDGWNKNVGNRSLR